MLAMLRCGAMSEVLSTAMRPAPAPATPRLPARSQGIGAGLPDTVEFFAKQNVKIMPSGQDPMRKFEREQVERWERIAALAKIELQ